MRAENGANVCYAAEMIRREIDPRDDIILVSGTGTWTKGEIDEHFDGLRRMIEEMRRNRRPVRILSDVTAAERQSPELEAYIKLQHDWTYRRGDRVALLVRDMDDKNHVRAVLGLADVAVFSSQLAAEMWLIESSLRKPA